MFEAHEEVLKQQRSVERQEAALQQLQGALQASRAEAQALASENAQLRQQLEAAAAAAVVSAKQATRPQLQLPIQQMLAAQAAAAAAGSCGSPAASARGGRQSLDGSYGGGGSPASAGSKIPRAQDRTPPRDQDGGGSAQVRAARACAGPSGVVQCARQALHAGLLRGSRPLADCCRRRHAARHPPTCTAASLRGCGRRPRRRRLASAPSTCAAWSRRHAPRRAPHAAPAACRSARASHHKSTWSGCSRRVSLAASGR